MQLSKNKTNFTRHSVSATLLCLLMTGCGYSNLTHSDKISPGAGDAVRAAALLQTVDPWPENVLDTEIDMNGELAVKRAEDYKQGKTKPLQGERSTGGSSYTPGG